MAAFDAFNTILEQLSQADRHTLTEYIGQMRSQMQAARSEDARMRLLDLFIRQTHEQLRVPK
jgi:hypothetical protein